MVVLVLFFGTAAAAFMVASHFHIGVGSTVIAVLLGGVAPAGLYLTWATYWESHTAGELTLPEVADLLAEAVGTQWRMEAAVRRLNDPFPLAVSWMAADPSVTESWDELLTLASSGMGWPTPSAWASGPDDLAGSGSDLASVLKRVPTGRLVVLGDRGAGKTVLMVRLILDLMRIRARGGPVPVLFPVASWNPSELPLFDWLATRLIMDHPALAQRFLDQDLTYAEALLAEELILPILDGLDEIPDETRGLAITTTNDALQLGVRLVLTCRTEAYRDAVRPRNGIEATLRAAVIQLNPLPARTVSEYLRADAPGPAAKARWDPVVNVLDTPAPVAHALTTPLMVGLARVIYNARPGVGEGSSLAPRPADLLSPRLSSKVAVERHLLDAYVCAAYQRSQEIKQRWKASDAERYLVFVARYLKEGPTDIAWWNLADVAPKHLVGLTLGILAAVASGVAYPFIGWGLGIIVGLTAGLIVRWRMQTKITSLTRGFLGGLLGGTAAALSALAVLGPGVRNYNESGLIAGGLAVGVAMASMQDFTASFVAGFAGSIVAAFYEHAPVFYSARMAVGPWLHLINAFGFGLATLFFAELAGRKKPARRLRLSPPWLALGIACGTALGIGVWLQEGWLQGLAAGVVTVIAGALAGGMGQAVPSDLASPADPRAVLRWDRTAFLSGWLGLGLAFGLGGGLALAISPNLNGQPNGIQVGVSVGLANVIVVGLTFGFMQAMWGSFVLARFWLTICRRHLPWQYMEFLEDAHKRGVLRQVGAVYQFRHIELQERLAISGDP